ncbi:MAG TPA: signal peptidase II [Marmoricola sp.]|jgi:signal peptidase II|nr:signal peptidase II [Marmoricola sp.]
MQAARGASLTGDQRTSRLPLLIVVTVVAVGIDQVSKVLAVEHLTGRAPVPVVDSLLQLTLARNPGAAFSTGTGLTPVISVFAICATVVVCWFAVRVRTTGYAWGIGLVLAGILGNLVDRLFRAPGPLHGHVVDFLQLPHWPVFNVADVCINVGALLIVVGVFRGIHLDGSRDGHDEHDGDGPDHERAGSARREGREA